MKEMKEVARYQWRPDLRRQAFTKSGDIPHAN